MQLLPVVDRIVARAALAAHRVKIRKGTRVGKKADRVRDGKIDTGVAARGVGGRRGGVHIVAPSCGLGAHVRRRLARLPVLVGDVRVRGSGEAPALVGEFVQDRAHLGTRERREARLEKIVALGLCGKFPHLRRETELLSDGIQRLGFHAALLESVQERLLHLEDALGRKPLVVLGSLPDVVVDLDELGCAVLAGPEVDLPGVVAAGRDTVELREADVW